MQFLIHAQGHTLETCNKAYVIDAKNEEEANAIAINSFENEFGAIENSVYTQTFQRTKKSILAYIFLIIPIFLSIISWKIGHQTYLIRPNLISCLYSLALYTAFIVRFKGIHRTVGSWIDIIFCILIILLLSSFIQMILVDKTIKLFWIAKFTIDTKIILPIAIILSWIGLKFVSLVCLAGIGVFALFNITTFSNAMGSLWGTVYIVSAFLGILLYLSVEPATVESITYFKKTLVQAVDYTKKDLIQVKSSIKNLNSASQEKSTELISEIKD